MKIFRHIFKSYDIRGLAEKEITAEFAFALGKAFAALRQQELPKKSLTIAVGRDMREHSSLYQDALMKGMLESGADVLDIGLVSTPAFYFGVGHLKADGGVMVSASHNPAVYNGFKLTRANAVPISGNTGISEIAEMVDRLLAESFKYDLSGREDFQKVEGIPELAARAEFAHAGAHPIKKMKIVVDSANG